MQYHSKNHSKYSIKYHIVFIVKYRKRLLEKAIDLAMKNIIEKIAKQSDFSIDIMETDKNHIHILVDATPNLSPLQIVNRLKSISTYRIWNLFPNFLKKHFWKEKTFWSDGYFICTTGQVSTEIILDYIANQG